MPSGGWHLAKGAIDKANPQRRISYGVPAPGAFVGQPAGTVVVDVTTGTEYTNSGTAALPVWTPPDATFPPIYGPEAFTGAALPADWSWATGEHISAGTTGPDGLQLRPPAPAAGVDLTSQSATFNFPGKIPGAPTAISARYLLRLDDFDPDVHSLSIMSFWDMNGPLTAYFDAAGLRFQNSWFTPNVSDPASGVGGATDHYIEIVSDGAYGSGIARFYLDGVEVVTLANADDFTNTDFTETDYQARITVTNGGATVPTVTLTALTLADGYQGLPEGWVPADPPVAPLAPLLDFEDGLMPAALTAAESGTVAVTADAALAGGYGLALTGTPDARASAYRTLPDRAVIAAVATVRLPDATASGEVLTLRVPDAPPPPGSVLLVEALESAPSAGDRVWWARFTPASGGAVVTHGSTVATTDPATITLLYDRSGPHPRAVVRVNGTTLLDATDSGTNGGAAPSAWQAQSPTGATRTLYLDDVALYNYDPGVE